MKQTVTYYYSDILSDTIEGNIEFSSEEDQVKFDEELKRILNDKGSLAKKMCEWLRKHSALNEIWRQNGEFVPECMDDFPFETLVSLGENANGYIGFNGLDENVDEFIVEYLMEQYKKI